MQAVLGELVNAAKTGLLALSVGVGLGVLSTLMEEEDPKSSGPGGARTRSVWRSATATPGGEVTLGGRHVVVSGPRVRSADGPKRSSWRRTVTLLSPTRLTRSCWSRCSPASACGALSARASRPARTSSRQRGDDDALRVVAAGPPPPQEWPSLLSVTELADQLLVCLPHTPGDDQTGDFLVVGGSEEPPLIRPGPPAFPSAIATRV